VERPQENVRQVEIMQATAGEYPGMCLFVVRLRSLEWKSMSHTTPSMMMVIRFERNLSRRADIRD
jgi:hypothetical protein